MSGLWLLALNQSRGLPDSIGGLLAGGTERPWHADIRSIGRRGGYQTDRGT
jgi:hypothetical protein